MEVREEFSALLDDELTPEKRDRIETHLSECADCLRELDSLKRVDVVYSGLSRINAPEGFEERVRRAVRPRMLRFPPLGAGSSVRWMQPVAAVAALLLVVFGALFFALQEPESGRFQTASRLEAEIDSANEAPILQELLKNKAPSAPEPERTSQLASADTPAVPVGGAAFRPPSGERFDPAAVSDDGAWESFVRRRAVDTAGAKKEDSDQDRAQKAVLREEEAATFGDLAGLGSSLTRVMDSEAVSVSELEVPADQLRALGYLGDRREDKVESARPVSLENEFRKERDEVLGVPSDAAFVDSKPGESSFTDGQALGRADVDTISRALAQGAPVKSIRITSYKIGADGAWIQRGYAGEPTTLLKRGSDELRFLVRRYGGDVSDIAERPARCIFEIDGRWYELEAEDPEP